MRFTTTSSHDDAGNILSVASYTGSTLDRVECYDYDQQRRLVEAWTTNTTTCGTPGAAGDGTTKMIKNVQPGDQVLAADPETGQQSAQTVTATWVHQDTLISLTITPEGQLADPNDPSATVGATTVLTTTDHPFWNHTDQQWQPAANLDPGHQLLAADHSQPTIAGLIPYTQHQTDAYNLTVTSLHTYYVLAGSTPVLVHNCPDDIPGTPAKASWPTQVGGNCKVCAERTQGQIGGDMVQITPGGGRVLGPSTNNPGGDWFHHWVVVKDGRGYDSFTGPGSMSPSQYKAQFEYGDAINIGF